MTRTEFQENITTWSELIEFCDNNYLYVCEDVVYGDSIDIDDDIQEYLRDHTWQELRDTLSGMEDIYYDDWYLNNDYLDYEYLDEEDFERYKQDAYDEMADDDWDDEEPEDDEVEDEEIPDVGLCAVGSNERVSISAIGRMSVDTIIQQRKVYDEEDARAKSEQFNIIFANNVLLEI